MTLVIKSIGIEDYLPTGSGRLKMLVVGATDTAKTTFASYAPKPIIADCEDGCASVADRKGLTRAIITGSKDMAELLEILRLECRKPWVERRWHTVVVDTVDAYQRLCKEDYLQAHRGLESFGGRDAWGFLEAKMSQLLTRLNALDMNVIVNAHYKATGDDDDGGKEVSLQLQGSVKFSLFGDFSLIGRTQAFYADVDGDRVRKFGITFRSSEEWPFLRDRLRITPTGWMEITFSEEDWGRLFATYIERAETLKPGQVLEVGEEAEPPAVGEGGPVTTAPAAELPLTALDRPSLVSLARGLGLPVRGNSTKGDLIDAIQKHREKEQEAEKETVPEVSHDEAVGTVVEELGAEVTSDYTVGQKAKAEERKPEVAQTAETNGQLQCAEDGCGKVLGSGDASVTKSLMKKWPPLCEQHYTERKKAKV